MPQIQVIPAAPSFGQKLAEVLGEAAGNIGEGYYKGKQREKEEKARKSFFETINNPQATSGHIYSAFTGLSEKDKKYAERGLAAILKPKSEAEEKRKIDQEFFNTQFGNVINGHQQSQKAPEEMSSQNVVSNEEMGAQNQVSSQEMTPQMSAETNQESAENEQPQENPQDTSTWSPNTLARAEAIGGNVGARAKIERDRRAEEKKERTAREARIYSGNKDRIEELSSELKGLDEESARLKRLQVLYSDPSKFPNAFIASLLSKEGQIVAPAAALLSPEAQEAIKLTIDSIRGAQKTFGGKVSNFETQTYLKRNATLMNSPEGRERILTDLLALNNLSTKRAQGIMDIIDEHGGSDKIPFEKAESIWRKRHAKEIENLVDRFVNPSGPMKEMPDAAKYQGRKIRNDTTGEVFISDGAKWQPFKGE